MQLKEWIGRAERANAHTRPDPFLLKQGAGAMAHATSLPAARQSPIRPSAGR